MNDLTFLDEELANEHGASDATLNAVLPGGKVIHISDNISPFKFLDTCPLMYHAFEYNSHSRLQASIEASSETALIALTRYCYTGSYLAGEPDGETILLLQHAETYKIAEDFDVPELQIMAHGNFLCQIEYACCLPNPPNDLLDTIRFIYRHFASDEARRKHNLVDTLLNYCVAVYLYHRLGESLDFLTAVHEAPAFRQDLCRTNIARNFEDDCAAEIIRLPSGPMGESRHAPTILASRELPSEMLYDIPCDPVSSDVPSTGIKSADSAAIEDVETSLSLSPCRRILSAHTFPREIPDQSKHRVSPSALSSALERYNQIMSSDSVTEETIRKYKRAKIDETTARLEGASFLPEAGPSSEYCGYVEKHAPIIADEDSYWEGTFGQNETQSHKAATGDTLHSSRRLLYDYGRRNVRPAQVATLSLPVAEASTLPHRPRNTEAIPNASTAPDTTSEDEGFAVIYRPHATAYTALHSPMSSPELVPVASIDEAMADDKAASDDEWTLL